MMKKAGVVGYPIQHSLSPKIFTFLSEGEKQDLSYEKYEVTPTVLEGQFKNWKSDPEFLGLNITIPHKKNILNLVDQISDEVRVLGACNVLEFTDEKVKAYNTDIIGISKTLESQNFVAEGCSALILGAGGAARAVAYTLAREGCKDIQIHNRTSSAAEKLIEDLAKAFPQTSFSQVIDLEQSVDLVVNATSLGMQGQPVTPPLPENLSASLAFDLVYTPRKTSFLQQAEAKGFSTVGGLNMLIHQAIATWEIWLGALKDKPSYAKKLEILLKGEL